MIVGVGFLAGSVVFATIWCMYWKVFAKEGAANYTHYSSAYAHTNSIIALGKSSSIVLITLLFLISLQAHVSGWTLTESLSSSASDLHRSFALKQYFTRQASS